MRPCGRLHGSLFFLGLRRTLDGVSRFLRRLLHFFFFFLSMAAFFSAAFAAAIPLGVYANFLFPTFGMVAPVCGLNC